MSDSKQEHTAGGPGGRVFVSYSREDAPFASKLVSALTDLGLDVWIDEQRIEAGEKWSEAIQKGLDVSELMIVVLTPSSQASENVRDEWQYFLDQDKALIPVLLEPAKVHFQLSRIQYVDFHERAFDDALVDLCLELERKGVDVPGFDSASLPEAEHGESGSDTAERVAAATAARADAPTAGKPSVLSRPLTWALVIGVLGILAAALVFGPDLVGSGARDDAAGSGADTADGALGGAQLAADTAGSGSAGEGDAVSLDGESSSSASQTEGGDDGSATDSGSAAESGTDADSGADADGPDPRVARSLGGATASGTDMDRSGHMGGYVGAVAQDGSRAYVGVGPSLVVLDLADPAHPLPLGRLNLPEQVHAVSVEDGLLHVAAGPAGLRLIDVSDPVRPSEVGSLPTDSIVEDAVAVGDHSVIVDSAGLRIVDVTNPGAPVESGLALLPGHAMAVAVSGDYAFVVTGAGSDALRVIDIGDPSAPSEIGTLELDGQGRDVVVADSIVVVPTHQGVKVVDVSDPSEPALVADSVMGPAGTVALSGSKAYVADESGQLGIVDLSNPGEPTVLGSIGIDEPGSAVDVSVGGGYAIVADGARGLHVLRVADPESPEAVGFYEELSDTRDLVALGDDLVAVANGRHGLALVDVTNTDSPTVVGRAPLTGTVDVARLGDDIVATVAAGDLHLVDVSSPTSPRIVATVETTGQAKSVAASGDMLVVGDGVGGMSVLDATDPSDVLTVSTFPAPGDVASVAVIASTAYLADVSSSELWVVDISNPEAPVETARARVPAISALAAEDDVLCVGDLEGNLRVYDISAPQEPREVGGPLSGPPVTDIFVSGGLAYVTDAAGVHIVDVSGDDGPVEVAHHSTPGSAAAGTALAGDDIVVVGGAGGMCLMAHQPSGDTPK